MFYFDTASQINLIISLCFPFCILLFSIWFKNAGTVQRLIGIAFWAPLLLNAASFLASKNTASQSFAAVSELLLLLSISVILILKPSNKRFGLVQFGLFLFPVIIFLVIDNSPEVQSFISEKLNTLPAVIAISLLNLYLLKKEKGSGSILFWAMLPAAAIGISGMLSGESIAVYIVLGFKLVTYALFMLYFHAVYLKDILLKIVDADQKLVTTNRAIDYEVKKRVMEIERVNQKLLDISKTDSLSKTLNKAAILDFIEKMILTKSKSEFSMLMFDIDDFKIINDTLGHVTGDKCIKSLAILARGNLREFDVIGRYGGDEFIIVLPGANTEQAVTIAERFRKKIDTTETPHFSISIGVSTYPQDGTTLKQLVEYADDGLYKSKAKGKNAVSHKSTY